MKSFKIFAVLNTYNAFSDNFGYELLKENGECYGGGDKILLTNWKLSPFTLQVLAIVKYVLKCVKCHVQNFR